MVVTVGVGLLMFSGSGALDGEGVYLESPLYVAVNW
jgi:hypothetical protein